MLRESGLEAIELELTDPKSVGAAADRALELTEGKLFALFNNAAYGQLGAIEDLPGETLRRQFEVNFFSWHDLSRRLIPCMRANGEGRIVQCSSVLGLISPPLRGAYNASKYALEALSDAMRHELAGSGVQVSLIEPGPIESRFIEHALRSVRHIDMAHSPHRERYIARQKKLMEGGSKGFKLGPEAVLRKLIHAVESPRPKIRYYVTVPTYFVVFAKRFAPRFALERLVSRS